MSQAALVKVLQEARGLLACPTNDFMYSQWDDEREATAHIDAVLERIRRGDRVNLSDLALLFAPTGSIQEVSESSGWGSHFLELATRFDNAIRDL
jgi:hypothetical protein